MTDQLEHDLRALLTDRAATVSADPSTGEQAIADRLLAGEVAFSDAPGWHRSRSGVWLVRAAAVALIAVMAAGALLNRADDGSSTSQSPTTLLPAGSQGSRLTLAGVDETVDCSIVPTDDQVLVLPSGECVHIGSTVRGDLVIESATAEPNVPDPGPDDLWNVHITFSAAGKSLTRSLTSACFQHDQSCADGRIVVLIDDKISDVQRSTGVDHFEDDPLVLPQDLLEVEARTLARDLNDSIGKPPPGVTVYGNEDYMLGEPDDAAKDVAERLMNDLLGDQSVTMSESEPGGGVREVTMETSTGAEVVATVVFDEAAEAFRVTGLASPGLRAEVTPEGELFAELPVAGTLRVRGFTEDFGSEVDAIPGDGVALEAGRQGQLAQPPDDYVWLVLRLEADDGQVLWWFSRR